MLDDLDWELDRRGHRFVRYADDGRIYVASERAGQRVMESITRYVEQRLKLRVNRQKSAVAPAVERPLLTRSLLIAWIPSCSTSRSNLRVDTPLT